MHRRNCHALRSLRRIFLPPGWRALALAALIPSLILGAFGGTSFLAHAHHGHGVHWHAAPSPASATSLASRHFAQHEAGRIDHACPDHVHDSASGCDSSAETGDSSPDVPGGLLITIPDHDQLSGRVVSLPAELLHWPVCFAPMVVAATALEPFVAVTPAPPRSRAPHSAPRALDHIVRTSCALII